MSHFVGIVFGPKDSIEKILEQYDENLEVEPYIDRTPAELMEWAKDRVRSMRKYVSDNENSDEEYFVKAVEDTKNKLKDFHNFESQDDYQRFIERNFDLDSEGNSLSTYNLNSKWDWYVEGGRWNGDILHAAGGYDTNQTTKENLVQIDTPYCFVDLEGNWHEQGEMGYWGMSFNEKEENDWEKEFRDYLNSVPDDTLLTVIDFHI